MATLKLSNKYIEAAIADTGRFTIGTVLGDPSRSSDDNKPLLYGHPNPSTSDTMVKIDNGASVDFTSGSTILAPTMNGNSLICSYENNQIMTTQTLSIVKSQGTRNKDTIQIKYTMSNKDTAPHNVALRIQLDTLLGTNDGAPFRVVDFGEVTTATNGTMTRQQLTSLTYPSIVMSSTAFRNQRYFP